MYHKPFSLGDPEQLRRLFVEAGVAAPHIETGTAVARFPSLRSGVETEVLGWLALTRKVDKAELERVIAAAERELGKYRSADGRVGIGMQAHLVRFVAPQ